MHRMHRASFEIGNHLHLAARSRAIAIPAERHARLTTASRLTGGSICKGGLIAPPAVNEPNGASGERNDSVARRHDELSFRRVCMRRHCRRAARS